MIKNIISLTFCFIYLFSTIICEENLKLQDINGLMENVFSKHVTAKTISTTIVKRALTNYVDNFDKDFSYFLKEERKNLIDISKEDLEKILKQYQRGDFSHFLYINKAICKAILRARKIRATFFANPKIYDILKNSQLSSISTDSPKNYEELKEKQKIKVINFLHSNIDSKSIKNSSKKNIIKMVQFIDKKLDDDEKNYGFSEEILPTTSKQSLENSQVLYILKSLTLALDAHSVFLSEEEAKHIRNSLEMNLEGIGVMLQETFEGIKIVKIIEGGSAEKYGKITVGDFITNIDGKNISNITLSEVVNLLHGKSGTFVKLTIKKKSIDNKENFSQISIMRNKIPLLEERITTSFEHFEGGIIGKISLHSFYENDDTSSEKDIIKAMQIFKSAGTLKGLILDLRDNPGGFLGQAIKVAGLFIRSGIVAIAKYHDGTKHFFRDIDGYNYFDGPIVVLVSKTSASASEIVAQALQDYGKAIVIGSSRTFGKGSIQQQNFLQNDAKAFFKVTVGRFYTVSGRSTQINGVKSDIIVPGIWQNVDIGEKFLKFPLPNDKISPNYVDKLEDIPDIYRSWFLQNYVNVVQTPKSEWLSSLSQLKRNSAIRVKNYSLNGKYDVNKYQMIEAVNIVKDMIAIKKSKNIQKHNDFN